MAEDETYFVRWRGRVTGPFGQDDLKRLIERGELSKFHELSPDRAQWQQAGAMPGLYPAYAPRTALAGTLEAAPVDAGRGVEAARVEADGGRWYYSHGGGVEGPCSWQEIERMVGAGELTAEDYVMSADRSSPWMPVGEVVEGAKSTPLTATGPADAIVDGIDTSGPSYYGLALGAFVLSMIGITGIIGIILGGIALDGMKRSGNRRGRGLAVAAIVLGLVDVLLLAFVALFGWSTMTALLGS